METLEMTEIDVLRERLADAERTIAKIGFCSPAPHEAKERYERKWGKLAEETEWETVKGAAPVVAGTDLATPR